EGVTPDEGHVDLTAPQGLRRQMGGHQRGRTGSVQGDGGTLEIEEIGDARGGDGITAARGRRSRLTTLPLHEHAVLMAHDPEIDTALATAQRTGIVTRVLERVVRLL